MQDKDSIKSSADLRKFVTSAMIDVRYGHLPVENGQALAKMAAQINESLRIELQAYSLLAQLGQKEQKIGALPLTQEAL